ncbi:MAG: hypothetical protein ACF8NJ_00255 [Phycisphaerales bacterium JB038]
MPSRHPSILAVLLALALTACLSGCGEKKEAQVQAIGSDDFVQRYAEMILDGVDEDGLFLKAAELDPQTGELRHLLLRTEEGMLTAERARFIVRAYDDTFSLKLMNVLVARSSSEESTLAELDSLTTAPIPAGLDVRDSVVTLSEEALLSAAESE